MPTMLVKVRVANFDKWKKVYDHHESTREQYGFTGHSIYRDASDPNVVVILNNARDLAGAKKFGASEALHKAWAEAGIQGAPEVMFLNDIEELHIGPRG